MAIALLGPLVPGPPPWGAPAPLRSLLSLLIRVLRERTLQSSLCYNMSYILPNELCFLLGFGRGPTRGENGCVPSHVTF
jgi:hypothetical protein